MKRRILSVLMVVMLLCSSMAVTSFAETTEGKSLKEQVPEAVVLVQVENAECKMIEKMTDLTVDIKLKDGRDVINVPVERVEQEGTDLVALWLGYSYDEIDAQIKADMAEFQKDYHLGSADEFLANIMSLMLGFDDMSKDLFAIFDNYEIVINGIPEDEDHEFEIETNTILITSTIVSELFDMAVELFGELFELSDAEIANINNFSDMILMMNNYLVKEEILKEGEDIFDLLFDGVEDLSITEEELQEAIVEMDELLAYMESEEYTGTVFAGVYLSCDCPFTVDFEIYHQYFKEVDGKMTLAGTVSYGPEDLMEALKEYDWTDLFDYDYERYYYEGLSGEVIVAEDYIQPNFAGETYDYVGSYDDWTLIEPDQDFYWTDDNDYDTLDELYNSEEWWSEYKFDEFVLADEDWEAPTGLVLRYELLEEADGTPQTSDESNMTPYFVIMFMALAIMTAAVVTRRKQTN